jgi:tripartite-type tricarboxylate transporter receptor subunit TctC
LPSTTKRTFLAGAAATAVALVTCGLSWAQEWPSRPITILVPQPAGTIQDMVARNLGDELSRLLKQPVVVDNRPSASQIIASSALARSAPDGYTLMISAMTNAIPPNLLRSQSYAGNQDFTVVSHSLAIAGFLAVSPQVPAHNLKEFIALLKANPDRYMYGSAGVGTPLHMFLEQFNRDARTKSVHVPYKSFQLIIPDVSTNTVQYSFLPVGMMQLVKEGKLKALGFVGTRRDPQVPDLPTLDEQGLSGFDGSIHYFVIGPKGMPVDIVRKLNAAINEIQAKDAYQGKYKALGGISVPHNLSPAQSAALLKREDARYAPLLREGRISFN